MNNKRLSIEPLLVVILMILLAISITVIIIQGSQSFDRMNASKGKNEDARIAMSYMNMMIKQNDIIDGIKLLDGFVENGKTIAIYHSGDETGLATYIYFKDGTIYEQYSDATDVLDPSASVVIIQLDDVKFSQNQDGKFKIDYAFDKQSLTQIIGLRTGQ